MVSLRNGALKFFAIMFWTLFIALSLYLPSKKKDSRQVIDVCLGAGVIDTKFFKEFEAETGIHVNATYFDSNEELYIKLLAMKGKGYDMLVVSDSMVPFFKKNSLLKKLDRSKLDFWDNLNPKFLGHYYDEENEYSIPAEWYALAIGINKNYFNGVVPDFSWDLFFNEQSRISKIGLANDPRVISTIASKYLNFSSPLTHQQIEKIESFLSCLRNNIEAYIDYKGDQLLYSGNCAATMIYTSSAWKYLLQKPQIIIGVPREGTFLNIENYAIAATTKKDEWVYKFINYLFRKDVQKHNFEHRQLLSTRKDADFMFNAEYLSCITHLVHPDTPGRIEVFKSLVPDEQVTEIWLSTKGA